MVVLRMGRAQPVRAHEAPVIDRDFGGAASYLTRRRNWDGRPTGWGEVVKVRASSCSTSASQPTTCHDVVLRPKGELTKGKGTQGEEVTAGWRRMRW